MSSIIEKEIEKRKIYHYGKKKKPKKTTKPKPYNGHPGMALLLGKNLTDIWTKNS